MQRLSEVPLIVAAVRQRNRVGAFLAEHHPRGDRGDGGNVTRTPRAADDFMTIRARVRNQPRAEWGTTQPRAADDFGGDPSEAAHETVCPSVMVGDHKQS